MAKKKVWGESKTIDAINTPSTRQKTNIYKAPSEEFAPVIVAKSDEKKVLKLPSWAKSAIIIGIVIVVVAGVVIVIVLIRSKLAKSAAKNGKNVIEPEEEDSPGVMDGKYRLPKEKRLKGGKQKPNNKKGGPDFGNHQQENPRTPIYTDFPTATDLARQTSLIQPEELDPQDEYIPEEEPEITGEIEEDGVPVEQEPVEQPEEEGEQVYETF